MKIAIEARALGFAGSGVRTYVRNLLRHLPRTHDYSVIHGSKQIGEWRDFDEYAVPLLGESLIPVWVNYLLPHAFSRIKPDVVHFTKGDIPWRKRYPTVVTIHDLIPILLPASQKFSARLYWPGTLRRAARASDHILAVSEATKRDIVECFQVDPEKITVTPLAVDLTRFSVRSSLASPARSATSELTPSGSGSPRRSRKAGLRERLRGPYVLFVGTIEPRKNVPLLVRAFARIAREIPHQLVIAGRAYKGLEDVRREVAQANLDGRVEILDFVPADKLPALYAGADLFVWPSVYEGWGLPPLEAMASGVPVIVSDGGSLPEAVGQGGEVIPFTENDLSKRVADMEFEEKLARRMLELLTDAQAREALIEKGLAQVRTFSWEKMAQATVRVYEQVGKSD